PYMTELIYCGIENAHIHYVSTCVTIINWHSTGTIINAGLKMDRNGRFESGLTETNTHLSIIHPAKTRTGLLGRPHKKSLRL
ncbi:MAG: hypothetical protein DRH15_11795, partial [Deltaproteobacteria bacterium]